MDRQWVGEEVDMGEELEKIHAKEVEDKARRGETIVTIVEKPREECMYCGRELPRNTRNWHEITLTGHVGVIGYSCSRCDKKFNKGGSNAKVY